MDGYNIIARNNMVITDSVSDALKHLKSQISIHSLKIFGQEDKMFTIDLSRAILKECSMTSENIKYIVLLGNSYKVEAQNSLLKLVEETPRNVVIYILANNKNVVLPTLLSRVFKTHWKFNKRSLSVKDVLDYKNITDKRMIDLLLKDFKSVKRDKLIEIIESVIILDGMSNNRMFSLEELDKISNYLKLLNLNSSTRNILTAFLGVLNKAYKRKLLVA